MDAGENLAGASSTESTWKCSLNPTVYTQVNSWALDWSWGPGKGVSRAEGSAKRSPGWSTDTLSATTHQGGWEQTTVLRHGVTATLVGNKARMSGFTPSAHGGHAALSLRRMAPDRPGRPFVCSQISNDDSPLQPGKHSPSSKRAPKRQVHTESRESVLWMEGWIDKYKRQTDGQIRWMDRQAST